MKGKLGWGSDSTWESHLDPCPAWKQVGQFQMCNCRNALTNILTQKCRPPCLTVEILKFLHDWLSLIKKSICWCFQNPARFKFSQVEVFSCQTRLLTTLLYTTETKTCWTCCHGKTKPPWAKPLQQLHSNHDANYCGSMSANSHGRVHNHGRKPTINSFLAQSHNSQFQIQQVDYPCLFFFHLEQLLLAQPRGFMGRSFLCIQLQADV